MGRNDVSFSRRCPDPKAALASIKRDKGEAKKKARAQGSSYLDQLFEDQPCMTKPVTVMIYDMETFPPVMCGSISPISW